MKVECILPQNPKQNKPLYFKQAKITLKETIEHGNKIYTLELEEIVNAPKKQVHSQAIEEQFSKSRKPEPMHPDTPLENPKTESK